MKKIKTFISIAQKIQPIKSVAIALGLTVVTGLSTAPVWANLPLLPGQAVTTRASGLDSNSHTPVPGGTVVNILDIRDPLGNGVSFGSQNWAAPNYSHASWNSTTMGEVYGLAIDDGVLPPDIYVTSSSSQYSKTHEFNMQPGSMTTGYGAVFKINGTTGAVSLLAELPSASFSQAGFTRYAGLGQVTVSPRARTLYVSNYENGMIYVLDTVTGAAKQVFDHGAQVATSPVTDDGTAGFTQYERRISAVQYHPVENRLYYVVVTANNHELWSAPLTTTGTIDTSGAIKEFTRSRQDWAWNNINLLWTDMAFDYDGKRMLVGFMTMNMSTGTRDAHYSGAREWVGSTGNWAENTALEGGSSMLAIGSVGGGHTNSAGAVAYGYNNYSTFAGAQEPCNDAFVLMGDALTSDSGISTFGLQISPLTGSTGSTMGQDEYFVDLDGGTITNASEGNDKQGLGDVEVLNGCAPVGVLPDLKLVKTVDKSTAKRGDTVVYTLTLTNESPVEASSIAVKDLLPAQALYMSQSGDGSYDSATGIWNIGGLASAGSKQILITVKIQ